jgi:hypothetical protein
MKRGYSKMINNQRTKGEIIISPKNII